jgi:FlaA1/EpsC-like NDP-sugar epimerase
LRPGEKLHEELVATGETTEPSAHDHILLSRSRVPDDLDLDGVLETLRSLSEAGDAGGIRAELGRAIPESQLTSDE